MGLIPQDVNCETVINKIFAIAFKLVSSTKCFVSGWMA